MSGGSFDSYENDMMKSKVVVICPGGAATGGVELLHQLVDSLTQHGCDAAICYYPFFKNFSMPSQYLKYRCPVVAYRDIKRKDDTVILPEVYSYLAPKFLSRNIYLWWMSVDNYVNSGSWLFALKNFFLPWQYANIDNPLFGRAFCGHLHQSEYAKLFLEKSNITGSVYVSDYINDEYVYRGTRVDYSKKKNIVVYNPAKGIEQTSKILPLLSGVDAIPIVNMSRDDVMDLLANAKIYIDFGNHPGKDRIPREAASMGCCVITNRRGSAGNSVDIPIGENYKIDDCKEGFERQAAGKILEIIHDFNAHKSDFDHYRENISSDKSLFEQSVQTLLQVFNR